MKKVYSLFRKMCGSTIKKIIKEVTDVGRDAV